MIDIDYYQARCHTSYFHRIYSILASCSEFSEPPKLHQILQQIGPKSDATPDRLTRTRPGNFIIPVMKSKQVNAPSQRLL